MDTFITGFISGIISSIAVYIFIQSVRRGKKDPPGSLEGRTDTNNISTERGLGSLRTNNTESGRILDGAGEVAAGGLRNIKDTKSAVSKIIADSIGDGKEEPEG